MRSSYILSVCTDWKKNSLKITAQCLNQGHQAELFNTSVICYKSFKFPVGDYEILSKVSLCSESHVSWPAESRLRRMRLERFHTINHCLLPLALLLFLQHPHSVLLPAFSLPAFHAAIFDADWTTNQAFFSSTVAFHPPASTFLPSFLSLPFALYRL